MTQTDLDLEATLTDLIGRLERLCTTENLQRLAWNPLIDLRWRLYKCDDLMDDESMRREEVRIAAIDACEAV